VNDLRPLGLVPWTTNTTPGGFDEQRFQNGGLKGALVVSDVGLFAQGRQKLDGVDKRLWRLEAMVMASTLFVLVAAATMFMNQFRTPRKQNE